MLKRPSFWVILFLSAGMFAAVYFLLVQADEGEGPPLAAVSVIAPDQEVAWLSPATSPQVWNRFLAGLTFLRRQHPELELEVDERQAYPEQTAAVPAVGLRRVGYRGTLWIRWYKLTGQQGTPEWVEQLLQRKPPPLVLLGGGSSDRARELAACLADPRFQSPEQPLLFFTNATADTVEWQGEPTELIGLYPDRTFRFCFTNRQMAEMLLDFIWHEPSLRPTEGTAFLLGWKDDPYSVDLMRQFRGLLRLGLSPASTDPRLTQTLPEIRHTWERVVPHSISSLSEANVPESLAAQELAQHVAEADYQERALIILPAEVRPVRRFLRTLFRSEPFLPQHLIVTTGDTVAFNSIYRDRRSQWPIQELPCPLVVFCHRDPANSAAGFIPEPGYGAPSSFDGSSTDDLLLYSDVAEQLIRSVFDAGTLRSQPNQVAARLRSETEPGRMIFDTLGNRRVGSGEFIALLEPRWAGERVLPQSVISIFSRAESQSGWTLQRRLNLDYAPAHSADASGD